MDCPHCGIAFHDKWSIAEIRKDNETRWLARTAKCPACHKCTIELRFNVLDTDGWSDTEVFKAYPVNTFRKPTPAEVPQDIKEDYEEACRTLPISEKASAALSRRCLQSILRDKGLFAERSFSAN